MGISGRLNWSDPRLLIILLDSEKGNIGPHRVESNRFQVPSYGSTIRRLFIMKYLCPRPSKGNSGDGSGWGDISATWTPTSYEEALEAPPSSEKCRSLVRDLVETHFPA